MLLYIYISTHMIAVCNYWRYFDTEHGQNHPSPVGIDVQILTGRCRDITWGQMELGCRL